MEIEQLAVERPEALARVAVDPNVGIDDAKAREIVDAGRLRRPTTGPRSPTSSQKLWDVYRERGRDARRGQPARQDRGRRHRRPRRQGHARRERRLPAPRPRRRSRTRPRPTRSRPRPRRRASTTSSSTATSASSATAPGLVMSTLDVVAYAGEEFGGVEAGQLPRHRWRRLAPRSWPTACDIILGDPQVKSVFVNVFGGITACDAVANGIVRRARRCSATRTTKPLVVRLDGNNVEEGRRILAEAQPPARDASRTPWTAPPARAAELRRRRTDQGRGHDHGDLPERRLQGHRPGHDRLRGHEAHPAHARVRHRHRRRRQPAQGRADRRLRRRRRRPGVRHGRRGHRGHRRRRLGRLRAAGRSPRPPSSRRSTPASRSPSSSPRASRSTTPRSSSHYARTRARRGSSARTAPA